MPENDISRSQSTKNSWRPYFLAVLAGLVHAASLSWPQHASGWGLLPGQPVWWVQLLALALLGHLLDNARRSPTVTNQRKLGSSGAILAWLFATAWLTATFWWTFVAMHTYGGLPAILAAIAVFGLAALLALYYAVAGACFVWLAPVNRAWSVSIFAALWLLAELARGTWLTGFSWGAAGYAHVEGPLAVYASWIGVYGLSALSAALAMTLATTIPCLRIARQPSWRSLARALIPIVLILMLGWAIPQHANESTHSNGHLSLTLLQGNIPQDEKFMPASGMPQALEWYGAQLQNSRTSLVIAPETALPVLPQQLPPGYWAALQQRFKTVGQAALVGMPLGNEEDGYTNSVVGFKAEQAQAWRYDKHHLVPFGEFIPPFFKWFTAMMNIPLGDFNRGALPQAPFEWQGQRLGPNVCYEDLFGEELGLQFRDPTLTPTIFVNISNLAWFGGSQAMDQHLSIARMRALEFERPFLLATNTGMTAIVDHRGRIQASLPRDTRAVLVGEVEGRSGLTPYARWVARFGLWPFWLLTLALVLWAWRFSARKDDLLIPLLPPRGRAERP